MKAEYYAEYGGVETTYIVMRYVWKETTKGHYQQKKYKYFTDWKKAQAFANENRSCTLYKTKTYYM